MNPWMQPKKEQAVTTPEVPSSNEGLSLPLPVEYDSLEKVVKKACWRKFNSEYPLKQEDAANFIPGKSADEAIRAVRDLAASVVLKYFPAKTFTKSQLRETVIELEACMATNAGIDCNLPGHERRDP